MAREKKPRGASKAPPPAEPAAPSPFSEDSDWDSELAAWDAALPIGTSPPPPATGSGESASPAPGASGAIVDTPRHNGHPDEAGVPADLDGTAPPDADSVQFDSAVMETAEHVAVEIAVQAAAEPRAAAPAAPEATVAAAPAEYSAPLLDGGLFPPFAREDVEEKTSPSKAEPMSLESSDAIEIVEERPLDRTATGAPDEPRTEGSGLFVIPDVEELAAMTGSPRVPLGTSPLPAPRPSPVMPERPAGSTVEREDALVRDLTADGLPELSGLFSIEHIVGAEPLPGAAAAGGDLFEASPPAEPPVTTLDLAFPGALLPWRPDELARTLAAAAEKPGHAAIGPDRRALRERLPFWTDELAAAREMPGDGRAAAVTVAGLAAARAAEQAGQHELAFGLYHEVAAAEPLELAALRGALRLRQAGQSAPARMLLGALAQGSRAERAVYTALVAECADPADGQQGGDGEDAAEHAGLPGPARALAAAQQALRAGKASGAAEALASAGRGLGGAAGAALLTEAARLHELAGEAGAATTLLSAAQSMDAGDAGVAFAALRAAVSLPPAQALPAAEETADRLLAPSLQGAVLRWAARLARAAGDDRRARALLDRVAHLPGATAGMLPERDRLALVSDPGPDDDDARIGAALSREGQSLFALGRAAAHRARGEPARALAVLRAALASDPTAVPLALTAEEIGEHVTDPALRDAAWAAWGAADPARRAYAHWRRARTLAAAGDGAAACRALEDALAGAPADGPEAISDPAFWELAWAALRRGDRVGAAAAFEGAARRWAGAGAAAEPFVAAFEERAAELRRADNPALALGQAAAFGVPGEGAGDPVALTTVMLDGRTGPGVIAALLKAEATGGMTHRALEAAGWMLQAGSGREALSWLLERRQQEAPGTLAPAVGSLLRRLARLHAEPATRPQVLASLADPGGDEVLENQNLELLRAEALEGAGESRAASEIYRALLGGPLTLDADQGLRRVLWADRDTAALADVYRADIDALRAANRLAPAAAVMIEQAQALTDIAGDHVAAAQVLATAHELDPASAELRFAVLAEAVRASRFTEAIPLLEATAVSDPSSTTALLSLAALLDEGRATGRHAARLLPAALAAAEDPPPLNLLVRRLVAQTRQNLTSPAAAEASLALARTLIALPGSDPRAAATLLVRVAEAQDASDPERAEALLREAMDRDPENLAAVVRLLRSRLASHGWDAAVALTETQAAMVQTLEHQAQALLLGAAVAQFELQDFKQAAVLLNQVLEADPAHVEASVRLRRLLERRGDHAAVAELLEVRLRAATDPDQVAALRLERAALLGGPLGDRGAAKAELRGLVNLQPQNVEALSRLAALELEDGAYAVAAELYIRQARFDRDPQRLRDNFLAIGRIYLRRLPDAKLAIGAYERVMRLEPDNREALEALSELYSKQSEPRKALAVTESLIERESDPQKRLPFLLRLAALWEKLGDPRRAGVSLKRAAEECPRSLQAVGELARFYERTKETVARHVLLDGSISVLRADLKNNPADLSALRTIIPLLRWRQRHACSAAAAQLLAAFSDDDSERAEAAGWAAPPASGRRLTPLANPALEDLALAPGLPPGVPSVMRLFGPTLAKAWKPNLKRWEVSRADRQSSGVGPRVIAETIAADLGVRSFELYLSTTRSRALSVEPGDPPALIIGREIAALGSGAVRFACGYGLRLVASHLDVLTQGSPADAGVLLAAIVRQFAPDFRHPELVDADVESASVRVARALPKALRIELAPFAAEIGVPFGLEGLIAAVQDTAARTGLLASGDLAASLRVLCAVYGQPLAPDAVAAVAPAVALLDFALSDSYEELVSALDAGN
jgi:lipopolysaccharide biosynthesis regulator YciM